MLPAPATVLRSRPALSSSMISNLASCASSSRCMEPPSGDHPSFCRARRAGCEARAKSGRPARESLQRPRSESEDAALTRRPNSRERKDDTMDQDDVPVGRLLTRRETLALLGFAGAAVWLGARPEGVLARMSEEPLAAANRPCVVRPGQTEGPYFVDEEMERSDVRKDPVTGSFKPGVPLSIQFNVSRVVGGQCRPLPNARVDLWQCDAGGLYTDVRDFNGDTRGQKYLRGHQVTGESGAANFTPIYPDWYP